ncbi:MAG: hypothetical protein WB543_00295 [Candidatus Acidiferrum sp.]
MKREEKKGTAARRSTHEDKSFLSIAGEFAVASELNRRHILASVTYGASKAADIFALDDNMRRVVRIEVKTTDKRRWVLSKKVAAPPSREVFWVLVQLPPPGQPPRFFVFSAQEIHGIWQKDTDEYKRKYEIKNGRRFESFGVAGINLEDRVLAYENCWDKITNGLK